MKANEIKIERTFDEDRIKDLITHSKIWGKSTDDYNLDKEKYTPIMNNNLYYLIACDNEIDYGFALLVPHNYILFEIHVGFLNKGRECGKKIIEWVWENTNAQKIIGQIPEFNTLAINYTRKMNFKKEGTLTKAFKRFDMLHDLHIYSLNKGVS